MAEITPAANPMKKRYKVSPLYGTRPRAYRSSQAEAETLAICCAAHYDIAMRVHDPQTGSLWVYDPLRRGWFCEQGKRPNERRR
jgi:hypothetical protein